VPVYRWPEGFREDPACLSGARRARDPILDVRNAGRVDHLDWLERGVAHVLEQTLSCPEDNRHDVKIELVEHPGCEELLYGAGTASDRDMLASRGRAGLIERRLDPAGDEGKGRAAPHRQRLARVVGEDEYGRVKGRLLAPPTRPGLIPGPGAASEHPAAHHVCAHAVEDLVDDVRVRAALTALLSVLLPPASCRKHPLV
jgi:hypothetical protein